LYDHAVLTSDVVPEAIGLGLEAFQWPCPRDLYYALALVLKAANVDSFSASPSNARKIIKLVTANGYNNRLIIIYV